VCIEEVPLLTKFIAFVVLENAFLIIKSALAAAIPDVSRDMVHQRARHEQLKMLMCKQDKHLKKKKIQEEDGDDDYSQKVYKDEFNKQSTNLKTYLKNTKENTNEIVVNLEHAYTDDDNSPPTKKGNVMEMPSLEKIENKNDRI
jgi:hypothetical protein